jgi:UPF0755 protein
VNSALRILLRLVTLVLGISLVIVILVGSFWYMWQDARGRTPQVSFEITADKIERGVLGLYLRYRGSDVTEPADPDATNAVTFVVELGESPATIAWHLEEMGLIKDSELFRRVVQYWGADQDIQAGVYSLMPSMTMEEIMRELRTGRKPSVTVTIPEGWRAEQIAAALEEAGVVSAEEFMQVVHQWRDDYDFLRDRPVGSATSVEGFLFPDTYQLPLQTEAIQVLDIMLQNWDRRVSPELRAKAEERGLTLYEVVTMASIVEREAVIAEERPVIAGVYYNRLVEGMHLQADPTVQYALGYNVESGKWWEDITQEQYSSVESPYNTYVNPGLPPGPICNPGLAAIEAALEPEESNYLFFVHVGEGRHVFAETYEEHLRNYEAVGGQPPAIRE